MNHALMLVGWDVTGVKVTGNVQEATASYNSLLDTCPKCGSVDRLYRHGVKEIDYRDAPAFGKQFVIRMKLSDAQWGALRQIVDHGPISAEEVVMPPAMDGSRRTKLRCHCLTSATMARLEDAGLITVARAVEARPVNAVGKAGHRRNSLVVDITDAGRAAVDI
jgi:hypothetical protein